MGLVWMLVPFVAATTSNGDAPDWAGLLISELVTGLVIGFALRAVVTGIVLATQLIDQQLGFPSATDLEDDLTGSALGRLCQLTALALFLSMGGHRLIVAALLDASATREALRGHGYGLLDRTAGLLTEACWLAVRIAAPVVFALVTSSLTVGMITRLLPQCNGVVLALPAQITLGLVLVFLSLTAVAGLFGDALGRVLSWTAGSGL